MTTGAIGEICRPKVLVLPKFIADQITGITTGGSPAHFFIKEADSKINLKVAAAIEQVNSS